MSNSPQIQHNAFLNTPFGAVAILAFNQQLSVELLPKLNGFDFEGKKITGIDLESKKLNVFLQADFCNENALVKSAYKQIQQYIQEPTTRFNLPANIGGTAFQQRVWQAISAIPFGQTRTYGQLARSVGSGPRAVANACGANNLPLIIPCHRVVGKNGLGGFMQSKPNGLQVKHWLLAHEGAQGFAHE